MVLKSDLAILTGWTFDYIETLSLADIGGILATHEARNKIQVAQMKDKKGK
jgi:hypothetical protein